ncbi:MAG: NADAR family protein [Minisyncoccia bacterium]
MSTIRKYQFAAEAIESDGIEGFKKAEEMTGTEVALALLVAHLRRQFGSVGSWPADPDIIPKVNGLLSEELSALYSVFSEDVLLFYSNEGYCLDNFSAFTVEWRGRTYPTVEHAYQAAKFITVNDVFMEHVSDSEPIAEVIRKAESPHEAKQLGNSGKYEVYIREDWCKELKLQIMEQLLRTKWVQHEYVRRVLGRSRGRIPIENSPTDSFWGRGPDWKGQNHLSRLWTKIRDGK